jgi:hypothetical protein
MKLILYLTASLLPVCAGIQAILGHAASACLLMLGSLIALRTLQRSHHHD